jgi:quercetin dioxygenase-like cupin family protein
MQVIGRNSGPPTRPGEDTPATLVWYCSPIPLPPGIGQPRRFEIPEGSELPMHDHDDLGHHEILVPICGEFRVYCDDGEEAKIVPGDIVISQPGQSHAVANIGTGTAEIFIFATPVA